MMLRPLLAICRHMRDGVLVRVGGLLAPLGGRSRQGRGVEGWGIDESIVPRLRVL